MGISATGETTDGNWTFKRVGFLHPKVTVREVDSKSEVAVFTITWAGDGVLEIHSDGKKFVFKRTSMWHSEWILKRSDSDEILLTIKPDLGLTKVVTQRKIGAEVELGPGAIREPRLSLIALVTWYVIILMTYDDYSSYASGITDCSHGSDHLERQKEFIVLGRRGFFLHLKLGSCLSCAWLSPETRQLRHEYFLSERMNEANSAQNIQKPRTFENDLEALKYENRDDFNDRSNSDLWYFVHCSRGGNRAGFSHFFHDYCDQYYLDDWPDPNANRNANYYQRNNRHYRYNQDC